MADFSTLSLDDRLLRALAEMDIDTPTEVQQAAIPVALQGKDLRVIARTGSGKTAAFVLPMLQILRDNPKPGSDTRALILLPTRELAQQTLKQVQAIGKYTFIASDLITGGEDFKVQAARMRKNPDILIGTPGRLIEHLDAGNLKLSDIQVLVLDESDRMLDMGFSEDVLRLCDACRPERQTLLFSATRGGASMDYVVGKALNDHTDLLLDSVRDLNPAVRQEIITVDDIGHRERLVQWLLANETYKKAVIFTNTRIQADRLGGVLRTESRTVFVLHGEKDQKQRKLAIDRLKAGGVNVLVATDVAARGLHVEDLDLVINFDMPRSGDEYVHRIGRTGRVGGEGAAISLVGAHEWNLMASIQRYLRQQFLWREVEAHPASFRGPKVLKSNGKAAGTKKKKKNKTDAKKTPPVRKSTAKKKARTTPVAKRSGSPKPVVKTEGGFATVKRRKKPSALD